MPDVTIELREALELLELWYGRWSGAVAGTPERLPLRTRALLERQGVIVLEPAGQGRGQVARGPAPMDPEKRKGKDRTIAMTDLEPADPKARARPLPGTKGFLPATRRWWRIWARSPQAGQFLESDWQRLEMLAHVVDAFFREEDALRRKHLHAEIRLGEEKFGATPVDRLRLRWRLVEAERDDERAQKPRSRSSERGDPRLTLVEEQSA